MRSDMVMSEDMPLYDRVDVFLLCCWETVITVFCLCVLNKKSIFVWSEVSIWFLYLSNLFQCGVQWTQHYAVCPQVVFAQSLPQMIVIKHIDDIICSCVHICLWLAHMGLGVINATNQPYPCTLLHTQWLQSVTSAFTQPYQRCGPVVRTSA